MLYAMKIVMYQFEVRFIFMVLWLLKLPEVTLNKLMVKFFLFLAPKVTSGNFNSQKDH